MKSKTRIKTSIMLLVTLVMMMATTITAFAAEDTGAKSFSSGQDAVATYGGELSNVTANPSNSTSYDRQGAGPDGTMYYWNSADESSIIAQANGMAKREAAKLTNEQDINEFKSVTDGMALKADTAQAYSLLSGFTGVLRVLLGIIVVIVSVGMTVYSGFDLCYIAFPVFRNKCEEAKQGGGGGFGSTMTQKGSNGENKLRFVSDDAQYAVTASETVATGQNAFVLYFKKRFVSYLVLAVLLFILLTGKITVFTDIALKLTQGIINAVQGI